MADDIKLFELDKFGEDLEGIIKQFGEEGRIFSNEEQFQFELALAIEHKYQKDEEERYPRVRLEVLSFPTSEGKNEEDALDKIAALSAEERKKMYTDIIIDTSATESIAIELKYKTKGDTNDKYYRYDTKNNGAALVFEQGASNLGCYYFLKDVERLEQLVNNKRLYLDPERKVVQGYAIIISNDDSYWLVHKEESLMEDFAIAQSTRENKNVIREKKDTMYQYLILSDDGEILDGRQKKKINSSRIDEKFLTKLQERLEKEHRGKNNSEKKVLPPITLKGKYPCNWHNYFSNDCAFRDKRSEKYREKPGFKYMIFTIGPEL